MTKIKLKIRKVVSVKANDDFTLECEMEDGEIYQYDMSYLHESTSEMEKPLKDLRFFKKLWIELGCITWANDYCVDGTNIALNGKLIKKTA
ncbi:MAG: DUF2442 domain-containing protein [Halobacteriovoraceae bacterium]|nr:DUF2442 domain-containing protein [Halobacteriovoraceae bacterium]